MCLDCLPAVQLSILLSLIDIAAGMSYLHSIGLLHSDLKGGNVLLKSCAPTKADPRGFVCKVSYPEPTRHYCWHTRLPLIVTF